MKKILTIIPVLIFLFFIPHLNAQTRSAKSDKARKNLESCSMVNKGIMTGDMSLLDKAIAPDAVDHAGMHGDLVGLDAIKAELSKFHSMVPDMKMEVIREIADDEYTFQWLRFSGTAATAEMGMTPGTKFDMTAIEVAKFRDGKAVEHWEFMQPADMMKMMPQSKGMGADSTMQK
jgi:predicted ester cyclase